MKKTIFAFLISLFSVVFADVTVGILNGPSCVPLSPMMENLVSIENEELKFEKFSDAKSLLPKLIKNEIDIGFLPPNVAAKAANSSNNSIICLAVTGQGNLSLISRNQNIKALNDLQGKTVYIAGPGATPDYMTKFLLSENLIDFTENGEKSDEKTVNLDFSIPTAQIAAMMIAGKIEYAVVPEPFSTIAKLKDSSIKTVINFQKEFTAVTQKQNYPLTVLVASRKFAEENTEVLNKFLELYSQYLNEATSDIKNTARLCEKHNLGLKYDVVLNSFPSSAYVFIPARDAKSDLEYLFQIFMKNEPSSIGGKLPDNDFYY